MSISRALAKASLAGPPRRGNPPLVAGSILLVVTLLAIVAMAHHPTVGTTIDTVHATQRIATMSRSSGLVHGTLIAVMLLTLYCLSEFASIRGFARPLIRSGAIAYAAGVIAMTGAALVSGFVIVDVATLMPRTTPIDLQIDRQLLILCGILNQACANFGAVAMSIGVGLWSLDLIRDRGAVQFVGAFGCGVGIVPIVGLATRSIRLDVPGMLDVVLLQAAWNLAIAALLIRAGRSAAHKASQSWTPVEDAFDPG